MDNGLYLQQLFDKYSIKYSDEIGFDYQRDTLITALDLTGMFVRLTIEQQHNIMSDVIIANESNVSKQTMLVKLFDLYTRIRLCQIRKIH